MKKTTRRPTKAEMQEAWYLIDAAGQVLGRLSSRVAKVLMGKDKATYDPAVVGSTKVVIINAAQIKVTGGSKLEKKLYYRHSGYPGGLKTTKLATLMGKRPIEVVRHAIAGMLPKNKLQRLRLANLKIYPGDQHPHQAQQPVKLEV
ncbi:50S ribosomal protein L13 [candidate division Kazan bacterium RBG_13_50_9]|uniref:Large ribosomal subunit protein uL13 n=1 Tax=candidate division Kazan bacterium RBG_13_50_9 TaxID=1798535 RepID=A0A1F4NSV7_UNCK3|nr:MAG: 50S ribosomal protein L13 [candidate division Kazan bacterium RBG_13_50_9]